MGFLKMFSHFEKGRFDVIITLPLSYLSAKRKKLKKSFYNLTIYGIVSIIIKYINAKKRR